MTATIIDAQDAAHSASVDAQGWAREFVSEWLRPMIEMQQARTIEQAVMMIEQMPPEMKAMMQAQNPEQYAAMMKAVDQLKKRGKNGNSPV